MSNFRKALGLEDNETPFPWQEELLTKFVDGISSRMSLDIPTGLGKTSVMAAWLVARSQEASLPRRLVYVVDRRAVVDQATREAEKLRAWVDDSTDVKSRLGLASHQSLPISTLRGQYVDNREWLENPSASAIVVGTVDMIGSRLLFQGYGVSRKMRPYHAALLGADTLFVLDEAHLVPPFERMLQTLVSNHGDFGSERELAGVVPDFKLLSLSATGRSVEGDVVQLTGADLKHSVAKKRLEASKRLSFRESDGSQPLAELLAAEAWELAECGRSNVRVIVFSNSRDDADKALNAIEELAKGDKKQGIPPISIATQLFVGARRVRERGGAADWLKEYGFLAGSDLQLDRPVFVFATSAGEVGVDLDADHMVCDLVEWERMVQRLGRVNRRGYGEASVIVILRTPLLDDKTLKLLEKSESQRTKAGQEEVAKALEQVQTFKAPVAALPQQDGWHDASPGAIRCLKLKADRDEHLAEIIATATSPAPLRPALTRPVVDAWSMTSLEKHTGRPLVTPWLRGWVKEAPQTTILWRRWLPVSENSQATEKKQRAEAKEFFEEAPPHLSETLETESSRVFEWLTKRAKEIQKHIDKQAKPDERIDNDKTLNPDFFVGVLLSPALDVVRMTTLGDLTFDGDDKKGNDRRKAALRRDLEDNILVLDLRFGGLSENGLLDHQTTFRHDLSGDDEGWAESGFRVRKSEDGVPSADAAWKTCFRFVCHVSPEGEPDTWLLVEKRKQAVVSEEGRSIAPRFQGLSEHQQWAQREADRLARRLGLSDEYAMMLRVAARLHDEGKRAERWQRAFNAPPGETKYAKTLGPVKFRLLDGYRHEFGSLPIVEADPEFQTLSPDLQELALHLVAAHHGFARPVIRTAGCDDGPPSALESRARDVALRFARLQRRWGPWGLAWWESLLRAADQRASREIETETESGETEATDG